MTKLRMIAPTTVAIGLCCLTGVGAALAGQDGATGIVASIDKGPVVADGDVTGKPTDFIITLDGSSNPSVAGRSLAAGDTIKVIFPPEFDLGNLDPAFPLADLPTPFPPTPPLPPMPCVPGNLQCTTAIMLKGWPQDPLFPPVLFHQMSIDFGANALVYTAVQNIELSPGIKQLHTFLHGVTNPAPGKYRVRVEAETGPGGSLETGEGLLTVLRKTQPNINVTSVFVKALAGALPGGPACGPGTNPPNPDNPIYQTAGLEEDAPFVWTFLAWGRNNQALDGISLRKHGRNHWRLIRNRNDDDDDEADTDRHHGRRIIGDLRIDAPPGARGQKVRQVDCPTLLPAAPVIGTTPGLGPQPVGRLDVQFTVGDTPGVYTTTLSLRGGNAVQMIVTAD